MINWKSGHSGLVTAVALAVSILLYYLVLVIPVEVPLVLVMILYFIPAALLGAVIDHGHANTPWRIRWHRLLLSWVVILAWILAAGQVQNLMNGAPIGLGRTLGDVWSALWPLMILAAVIAWIGIAVVRWIEKGNTALLVIDQPKKKL